jgi:CRISPR/Cas system CMR subunit Cmr6 (Cas7 group RAMP superfamily)
MIALYQSVDMLKHKFGSKFISRAATSILLTDEKTMLTEQEESYAEKEQRRKAEIKQKQKQIREELKKFYNEKRKQEKELEKTKITLYEEDVYTPVYKKAV